MLHQGGTSTVARSYEKLLAYVEREGFRMRGPLYELDMNSYLMSASADDYLLHISVLVDVEMCIRDSLTLDPRGERVHRRQLAGHGRVGGMGFRGVLHGAASFCPHHST